MTTDIVVAETIKTSIQRTLDLTITLKTTGRVTVATTGRESLATIPVIISSMAPADGTTIIVINDPTTTKTRLLHLVTGMPTSHGTGITMNTSRASLAIAQVITQAITTIATNPAA